MARYFGSAEGLMTDFIMFESESNLVNDEAYAYIKSLCDKLDRGLIRLVKVESSFEIVDKKYYYATVV